MKIAGHTVRFTAPKPTGQDDVEVEQEVVDPDVHLQQRWTGGPRLRTRAVHGVLVAALVTGPAALLLIAGQAALSSTPTAAPTAAVTPLDEGGEQAAVGELAKQLVVQWLQTKRGDKKLLNGLVDTTGLELSATPMSAKDPAVSQLVPTGPGRWSVTVAVTVTDAKKVPIRRYFAVPVIYVRSTGAVVAATLPAPIAAPPAAAVPTLGYQFDAAPSDPVSAAAREFLAALLTGVGDITRFTSPGVTISAIAPAPFTTVELRTVSTDVDLRGATAPTAAPRRVRVLVTAAAAVTDKQAVTVQYALTLATREGRWEVDSLDPAPMPAALTRSPLQPALPLVPTTAGSPAAPTSAPAAPTS